VGLELAFGWLPVSIIEENLEQWSFEGESGGKKLFAKLVVRVLLWDTSFVFGFEVLIVEENRSMEL
jgi:hypothetical protein